MIMTDRDFGKNIPGILEFLYHFQTNCSPFTFQFYIVKNTAPNQTEIAIDISQFEAKDDFNKMMIESSNNLAMERIIARNFIPVNNINALLQTIYKIYEFQRIVLGITVRIKDPFLCRRSKT